MAVGLGAEAQRGTSRASDQQLEELLRSVQTRTDTFRGSLEQAIDHHQINGTQAEDRIDQSVKDFDRVSEQLRDRVAGRRSSTADVEEVLKRASVVDSFMARTQLDMASQRDWAALRRDLDGLARAYGVIWNWTGSEGGASRVNDQQVKQLLTRIRNEADRFRGSLDKALDGSRLRGSQEEDSINQSVADFATATTRLRTRFNSRQMVTGDIEDVLRRGGNIDRFMFTQRGQLAVKAENDWVAVRRDLDGLARAYNVAWSWSDSAEARREPGASLSRGLTGTYQLESNRGDDPRQAAERAARSVPSDRQQATSRRLMYRLSSPEAIAIDRNGNHVTMASSLGQRVAFEADGRSRTEQGPSGRTIETTASLDGDRLVVTTKGNRGNDYTVTFEPADNDRNLRVTRRIFDDGLGQPVTVQSFYRRSSNDARWDIYDGSTRTPPSSANAANRDVGVPDGIRLVATLDDALSTETAREGDRVTMTTRSPSQYQGAVLEGVVSSVNASGRVSGRADMTLGFQSIRVRNGGASVFEGVIESVRTPAGETIRVDNAGTVEGTDSQTGKTVQRTAIGAGLGALIGAIAGGAKGAAIGAAIGAGGGAGTVMAGQRGHLELPRGTEVTITSGAATGQRAIGGGQR
jgi:hypothetical protein